MAERLLSAAADVMTGAEIEQAARIWAADQEEQQAILRELNRLFKG